MFALPGIVSLIVLILLRPQEIVPALQILPTLHIALLMAVVGFAIDVFANITKVQATPITYWGLGFFGWCSLTLMAMEPSAVVTNVQRLLISVTFGFVVAHGVTTPRGLSIVASTVLACAVVLAGVGIHQGLSPKQCLVANETAWIATGGKPDGRLCNARIDCYEGAGKDTGAKYLCEHVGLWGTTSIGNGRVRYRGVLKDPNELALTIGIALPIAYALRREHGGLSKLILALAATFAILLCTVFTGSRGGQVVILCVLGVYFIVRTGIRGVVLAGALAVPALMYGGRSGSSASSSTLERVECWNAGLEMFFRHPVLGVGYSRFGQHHYLTAHSSYILSLAELGPVGLWLFIGLLYSAGRATYLALGRYKRDDDPRRAWAVALLATVSGLAVGVLFLSFSYNHVLWLFVGLIGAFCGVLRQADPGFRIAWRTRDTVITVALAIGITVATFIYTRLVL